MSVIYFGSVIKHVRHSFDFFLCSISVSNFRKACDETPHVPGGWEYSLYSDDRDDRPIF